MVNMENGGITRGALRVFEQVSGEAFDASLQCLAGAVVPIELECVFG